MLFINFLTSISAVGSAGFVNLMIMRNKEMRNGITLHDKDGIERGKSPTIGKKAVISTALTRFLMPVPALLLPTLTFYFLEKKALFPKNKAARFGVECLTFFSCLAIAPPLACSLFKQDAKTSVNGLEKEFQGLKDSRGQPITELYYNKGI